MSEYTYKQILNKAKECTNNLKKEYKNGISTNWSYYFAKAVITPNKNIKKISFKEAPNQQGNSISRGISKKEYVALAKEYVAFVEKNKRLPNYIKYKGLKIPPHLIAAFFAKVLVNKFPDKQTINSKWYTKPVETGNKVYDYTCKKFGKKFTTIDGLLEYVQNYFTYLKYFDDQESNQEVVNKKAGNCVDLLHWLINNAEAMGYEWKCIHVKCRSSGTGHVFGKFKHKKHTGNEWITRDPASVASGNGIRSVWCSDGYLQATNPSWFLENLRR